MAATVRCPICRKQVSLEDPTMPFCSDRCRLIDLGNWAAEKYSIPVSSQTKEFEEDPEGSEPEGPVQ